MLKTVEQLYYERTKTIRFRPGNNTGYFMDFGWWRTELPSDRDFFIVGKVTDRIDLVARGYGAKDDYGSGSIFVSPKELEENATCGD